MIQRNEVNLQTNWQKELATAFNSLESLLAYLEIKTPELTSHDKARTLFPMRVPRPFAAKMKKGDINDPLLRQVMPHHDEFIAKAGFVSDPLNEQTPAQKGILHKYKSRALVLLKTSCAVNCRYCFRRDFPYKDNHLNKAALKEVLEYLSTHTELNEVILSGGDPLMANDENLTWLINEIEIIPHITRLRIHSRLPVVLPSRVTKELATLLANSRLNTVLVTHINHANEIDDTLSDAMQLLKAHGVTLLNQAVLLKGVNDSLSAQVALSERLFDAGILPYYLHLFDKVTGATHFYVDDQVGIALMHEMLKELPGFLVPKLVREVGGEKSKTPIDLGLSA